MDYNPFKPMTRREEDTMSFIDSRDPIYKTMTAKEQEAYDKLPLEEKEYQRYVFRMRIFPPYDQKILTREEFYERFQSARFLSTIKSE